MRGEKMSILIKNMKMPEDCRECPLEMYYMNIGETRCRAENKILAENFKTIPFDGRPDFCPLVEVPVPHGRIADMDEAIKCIEEVKGKDAEFAISLIEWACGKRTVIEAEGTE